MPRPVSTTSTAFDPTMMPILGTSGADPSGIAQTWSVSFSVTPSRTSEAGAVVAGGVWASAVAAATAAIRPNVPRWAAKRMESSQLGDQHTVLHEADKRVTM